jgi:hypothetical protein
MVSWLGIATPRFASPEATSLAAGRMLFSKVHSCAVTHFAIGGSIFEEQLGSAWSVSGVGYHFSDHKSMQ